MPKEAPPPTRLNSNFVAFFFFNELQSLYRVRIFFFNRYRSSHYSLVGVVGVSGLLPSGPRGGVAALGGGFLRYLFE